MKNLIDLKRLAEERIKKIAHARSLIDKANDEKRSLSDEESAQYDKLVGEAADDQKTIERELEVRELERSQANFAFETGAANTGSSDTRSDEEKAAEQRSAFGKFLINGVQGLTDVEKRALQADIADAGGYTVAPMFFLKELLKNVDDLTFVRRYARKFQLEDNSSLGVPSLDNDPADADWTSELAIGSEDSTMSFGNRELKPNPLGKYIKISNKLLRASAIPAEQLVRERLAYKFGITQEKAFLTGNGVGQPLGVFTASSSGISTGRDVSTDMTATAMTMDGLKNVKFNLKQQYHANARWLFHRDGVKQIAKLKDSNNNYLWQPSVVVGEPDRLLNFPVDMSEYAPNTFTTGLYVGLLGDWSKYWIADSLDMTIQKLIELYAGSNQTGFIGRVETDGMPVLEEAFVRVKLA